jgi:ABC-type branched-subunit amino acid transport system substrate-binding protein
MSGSGPDSTGDDPFEPPETEAGRRRKRRIRNWRIALASLGVLVLLATGSYVGFVLVRSCGTGLTKQAGECFGVTDLSDLGTDSSVFDPSLKNVEAKIRDENQSIAGQPAVTVAVLMPLSTTTDLASEPQIVSHVEGAYIAQREQNSGSETFPKIRLVLANEGSREQFWQPVVNQLDGMVNDTSHPPLAAVTGLGLSVNETSYAARALSSKGIPMVGAEFTADGLDSTGAGAPVLDSAEPGGPSIPGVTRVIPSNEKEVDVLGDYVHNHDLGPAMLVDDHNPDDLYASTLAEDFKRQPDMAAAWRNSSYASDPFDAQPGSQAVGAEFEQIVDRLCEGNASTVLYAGRARLLPDFIRGFGQGGQARCQKQITVVTGSDATAVRDNVQDSTRSASQVTVVYAASEDPVALGDRSTPGSPAFRQFAANFAGQFNPADLDSGWAVMGHDAVLAASRAIRNAAKSVPRPTLVDVRAALRQFNADSNPIPGASGEFWFDETTGDRVGPTPPVMKLSPEAAKPCLVGAASCR